MDFVFDSSAILADFLEEKGCDVVRAIDGDRHVSSVNFAEVHAKLFDLGVTSGKIAELWSLSPYAVQDFVRDHALISGQIRPLTRHLGLSLGDRACLALAIQENATVLTADRAWSNLDLGIEIKIIR